MEQMQNEAILALFQIPYRYLPGMGKTMLHSSQLNKFETGDLKNKKKKEGCPVDKETRRAILTWAVHKRKNYVNLKLTLIIASNHIEY
jgi:hypothetical protein